MVKPVEVLNISQEMLRPTFSGTELYGRHKNTCIYNHIYT